MHMMNKYKDKTTEDFFLGKRLYGDDFSDDEILSWYKEEEEGYANLGSSNTEEYKYQYTEMNKFYALNL